MRRERLPIDDIDNADRMLGLVILAGAMSAGIWCLVHFVGWVLS